MALVPQQFNVQPLSPASVLGARQPQQDPFADAFNAALQELIRSQGPLPDAEDPTTPDSTSPGAAPSFMGEIQQRGKSSIMRAILGIDV